LRPATSDAGLSDEYRALDDALSRASPLSVQFHAEAYDPAAVARARDEWRRRMAFEYRSSMVFAQLVPQLHEAGASIDAQVVMLRMAQDELRHTRTCAGVVEAMGGVAAVEHDPRVAPLAAHGAVTPEERALRNVLYTTSLSEMVACARFVATLDHTTDPPVREALRRLLGDEVIHGQFGFHYLASMGPWLDAHPEARRSLERYLVHAFWVLESELAPRGPFTPLTGDERALGVGDPALAREVFHGTIEGAVVPGLERLGLDAGASWRSRRRLD
jgi:hypothetical protein